MTTAILSTATPIAECVRWCDNYALNLLVRFARLVLVYTGGTVAQSVAGWNGTGRTPSASYLEQCRDSTEERPCFMAQPGEEEGGTV
jgi:hypothetical protein